MVSVTDVATVVAVAVVIQVFGFTTVSCSFAAAVAAAATAVAATAAAAAAFVLAITSTCLLNKQTTCYMIYIVSITVDKYKNSGNKLPFLSNESLKFVS